MGSRALPLPPTALPKLRRSLLAWYDHHRRDLPWRRTRDPYHVWVSEIMLQQTRVAAVLEHYARFMKRFPTVQTLAESREASVLAVWSGLGYYHRARRLHQAAKMIVRERRGKFPRTAAEWSQLPGIGRYTAAALASIVSGEPVAVVDGNVDRILQRMSGSSSSKGAAWHQAEALLDRKRPGDFNQAMMELGATICTPRAPQCLLCPVRDWCNSRGEHPVSPRPPRKDKQLCYGLAHNHGNVLLVQRQTDVSLMAGMWELPPFPGANHNHIEPLLKLRHSITDTDYQVSVMPLKASDLQNVSGNARWVSPPQWKRLPLTGLARKILHRLGTESAGASRESKLQQMEV